MLNEIGSFYVAGPMTGIAHFNRPAFDVAERYLCGEGFRVMNPAVLPLGFSHEQYMSIAIPMLLACDAVAFLPGWRQSKGELMEYDQAQREMKPCFELEMGQVEDMPYVMSIQAMPGVGYALLSAADKQSDDLDWLARNIHKWPAGDHQSWCYVITHDDGSKTASGVAFGVQEAPVIEMSKWLVRRADFQNKPDWRSAPEWAEWMAQNSSGWWGFGSGKAVAVMPTEGGEDGTWHSDKIGFITRSGLAGEVLGNWRDTLEHRPVVNIQGGAA